MSSVVVFVAAVLATALAVNPEENIGLNDPYVVEGDIQVTPEQKASWFGGRAAIRRGLWPGAVMPYEIDASLSHPNAMRVITDAIKEWEQKTCIRFVKRTTETAYVYFIKGNGCSSFVGKIGKKQSINLGAGCLTHGITLHEIGHALGFHHEQNRSDRDTYVTILWDNIIERYKFAFHKQGSWQVDALGTPYDYSSIMHYGKYAFSLNGQPTISVKQSAYIGQRSRVSVLDAYQMNRLYKCPGVTEMPFTTIGPPQSGYYMYIEASNLPKGYIAKIKKTIKLSGSSCLIFYYNMYGANMGSLRVLVKGQQVFELSGDQGMGWKMAEVKLQGTGEKQLEFHGIVGSNYQSDVAVDDVSMSDCHSPQTPTATPVTTSTPKPPSKGFRCNFDTNMCGFTQETSDNFDWTRFDQRTPTWDSGPDEDHTTGKGFYLYTEASGQKQGDIAILSKTISLSRNTCLRFYYHMHGQQMGSLRVLVGGKNVFERTGPQGKVWKEAVVRLHGTGDAKLAFQGVVGSSFRSDAGIDDVFVGECT